MPNRHPSPRACDPGAADRRPGPVGARPRVAGWRDPRRCRRAVRARAGEPRPGRRSDTTPTPGPTPTPRRPRRRHRHHRRPPRPHADPPPRPDAPTPAPRDAHRHAHAGPDRPRRPPTRADADAHAPTPTPTPTAAAVRLAPPGPPAGHPRQHHAQVHRRDPDRPVLRPEHDVPAHDDRVQPQGRPREDDLGPRDAVQLRLLALAPARERRPGRGRGRPGRQAHVRRAVLDVRPRLRPPGLGHGLGERRHRPLVRLRDQHHHLPQDPRLPRRAGAQGRGGEPRRQVAPGRQLDAPRRLARQPASSAARSGGSWLAATRAGSRSRPIRRRCTSPPSPASGSWSTPSRPARCGR